MPPVKIHLHVAVPAFDFGVFEKPEQVVARFEVERMFSSERPFQAMEYFRAAFISILPVCKVMKKRKSTKGFAGFSDSPRRDVCRNDSECRLPAVYPGEIVARMCGT